MYIFVYDVNTIVNVDAIQNLEMLNNIIIFYSIYFSHVCDTVE